MLISWFNSIRHQNLKPNFLSQTERQTVWQTGTHDKSRRARMTVMARSAEGVKTQRHKGLKEWRAQGMKQFLWVNRADWFTNLPSKSNDSPVKSSFWGDFTPRIHPAALTKTLPQEIPSKQMICMGVALLWQKHCHNKFPRSKWFAWAWQPEAPFPFKHLSILERCRNMKDAHSCQHLTSPRPRDALTQLGPSFLYTSCTRCPAKVSRISSSDSHQSQLLHIMVQRCPTPQLDLGMPYPMWILTSPSTSNLLFMKLCFVCWADYTEATYTRRYRTQRRNDLHEAVPNAKTKRFTRGGTERKDETIYTRRYRTQRRNDLQTRHIHALFSYFNFKKYF